MLAQAIGRWGNYFNQELFGGPTNLPWAVQIDAAHRPDATAGIALYHPTFLYEPLWNLGVFGLLLWADRRFRLGGGRLFTLYVAAYTAGRVWIEAMRVDDVNHILGLRLNIWTSLIVFGRRHARATRANPTATTGGHAGRRTHAAKDGDRHGRSAVNGDRRSPDPEDLDVDVRFLLANERTLLAWLRTGLTLMAGGVALVQLSGTPQPQLSSSPSIW